MYDADNGMGRRRKEQSLLRLFLGAGFRLRLIWDQSQVAIYLALGHEVPPHALSTALLVVDN